MFSSKTDALSSSPILFPAETVCHIWLPLILSETVLHDKLLSAKSVRMILLPAKTLGRKHNHADSLAGSHFTPDSILYSLGRKQEIADSLCRSQR